MLQSYAYFKSYGEFTRPQFGSELVLKDSTHPILIKMLSDEPVCNDSFASKEAPLVIITGANMSGKSTYLRQIALLQILAQCGSFIPAAFAQFRVARQIFSRLGTDDDIELNSSSFQREMFEMDYILKNCDANSLVLIDELCRSTSYDEGVAISLAICESLILKEPLVYFATHYVQMTNLDLRFSKVSNYHLMTESSEQKIKTETSRHTFKLMKGKNKDKDYG